jgi:hypothetical protein
MAAMTEDQLNDVLNQQLAKFLGQVTTHIDRRVDDLQAEVTARLDRIGISLDGLAKRLDTDDQERLAMTAQLDRQKNWITQLAQQPTPNSYQSRRIHHILGDEAIELCVASLDTGRR